MRMRMTKQEFDKINRLEGSHWWYAGMREISFDILSRFMKKTGGLRSLDIGCGAGGNLKELQKFGDASGVDLDPYAVELCRQNGFDCRVGDLKNLDLAEAAYDVITLFDVLNQIPYGQAPKVLADLKNALKEGGILMMREPAMKIAAGKHDEAVNIHFRLERREAEKLVVETGFEVLYVGYINALLFLPIFIKRKVDYMMSSSPRSDVYVHGAVVNTMLLSILRLEKLMLRFLKPPFGISILIVAMK